MAPLPSCLSDSFLSVSRRCDLTRFNVLWKKNDIPPKKNEQLAIPHMDAIGYIYIYIIIPSSKLGSISSNINYHKHGQLTTAHWNWVVMNYQPKLHALFTGNPWNLPPQHLRLPGDSKPWPLKGMVSENVTWTQRLTSWPPTIGDQVGSRLRRLNHLVKIDSHK